MKSSFATPPLIGLKVEGFTRYMHARIHLDRFPDDETGKAQRAQMTARRGRTQTSRIARVVNK